MPVRCGAEVELISGMISRCARRNFKPRWRFVDIGLKPKEDEGAAEGRDAQHKRCEGRSAHAGAVLTLATKAAALVTDVSKAAALARDDFIIVESRGAQYSSIERRGAGATGKLIN